MTAYKDLRRHPAPPKGRLSNHTPARFTTGAWPGFTGGLFGSAAPGPSGGRPAKPYLR
ncbi:hypothetical protein ABIE89_005725 [Bradyrhizobium niftali]|uniref:hypothetical protein n=1 Tax=Bradyrhizobium niftali TaxID=2560055 RepID=UPI003838DB4A